MHPECSVKQKENSTDFEIVHYATSPSPNLFRLIAGNSTKQSQLARIMPLDKFSSMVACWQALVDELGGQEVCLVQQMELRVTPSLKSRLH